MRQKPKPEAQEFTNLRNALSTNPELAPNVRARIELMIQIADIVKTNGWTQTVAAKHCRITQPRMNDMLRGRINRFSIDGLVNMAAALGYKLSTKLHAA